jgi:hypothetical protein
MIKRKKPARSGELFVNSLIDVSGNVFVSRNRSSSGQIARGMKWIAGNIDFEHEEKKGINVESHRTSTGSDLIQDASSRFAIACSVLRR